MRPTRPFVTAVAVLLFAVGLSACGSDSGTSGAATSSGGATTDQAQGDLSGGSASSSTAAGTAIEIKDFAFSPATLEVERGATVTVTNSDSTAHTWTADDGTWDGGRLAPGKSASHTFDTAGTFTYHCEIHPSMKGKVVVR